MTDEEFVRDFEACTFPIADFHHANHVRLAWVYLTRHPTLEALGRFCESLKRFAGSHGKGAIYHETITWAYVLLINERIRRAGVVSTWEEFAGANPDLLDWKDGVLRRYYREETLASGLARRTFVFPDRCGHAAPEAVPTPPHA